MTESQAEAIVFILLIILGSLFLMIFWNLVLVETTTICKPINYLQAVVILLFISVLKS